MADALCRLPRVLLDGRPAARALLCGSNAHPGLRGEALFYPYQDGTLLLIRALGLPGDGFYACHIHALGDCCTGGRRGLSLRRSPLRSGRPRAPEPRGRSPRPALQRRPGALPRVYRPISARAGAGPVGGTPRSARRLPQSAHRRRRGPHCLRRHLPCGLSRARMACHAGPAFCSLFIYCILFCYPTVTTRTTASPPSAPL